MDTFGITIEFARPSKPYVVFLLAGMRPLQ